MSFWFSKIAKSKPHDRNEFVTLGIVRIGSRNETETEELLRNETETFWRNVTVSLRIVPAVEVGVLREPQIGGKKGGDVEKVGQLKPHLRREGAGLIDLLTAETALRVEKMVDVEKDGEKRPVEE